MLCSRAWRFRLFCASGCGPSDGGSLSSVDVGLGTRRGSCYDKEERSAKVSASPYSSVDGSSVLFFYVRFYLRFLVLCLRLVRFGSDEVEAQMERVHGVSDEVVVG